MLFFLVQSQMNQIPLRTHADQKKLSHNQKNVLMLLSSDLLGILVAAKLYKLFTQPHIFINIC